AAVPRGVAVVELRHHVELEVALVSPKLVAVPAHPHVERSRAGLTLDLGKDGVAVVDPQLLGMEVVVARHAVAVVPLRRARPLDDVGVIRKHSLPPLAPGWSHCVPHISSPHAPHRSSSSTCDRNTTLGNSSLSKEYSSRRSIPRSSASRDRDCSVVSP